ncbi:hypothetical protein Cgig2_028623 [Carnegiea gigantea]|uniref:Uncharacterized protein n=1 Tax=Carnegiea gigantea TaxID=171969 RepID=A0A9Q1QEH6_9CARY|nr:hypothetical protein Cgig2_028623 [Carnegiea gigantea]
MLDKTSMTDEEEQVNEKEHHSKGVENEGKAEDQTGISKVKVMSHILFTISIGCFHQTFFWDGWAATNLIITRSRRLTKVITNLEELIHGARSALKRVRKVVAESVSDALIRDMPKRSNSRMLVLSQDSYESEGFLMQIDIIEKHFAGSRDKFAIPSFSLRVSQEAKESLPEGVVTVDSQPNGLAAAVQGGNEKRMMYQKAFITRMTIRSFSSMVSQLNEAQNEAVRSLGFASFLKVDLKQIPGQFLKWLVESFDPYCASFVLPDGQRFIVTAFDVYVTLGEPIGEREIMEITKSSMDKEYDKVHVAWVKEWKIQHNALELTRMPEFILAKKTGKSILKCVKDVNQIASLDWCKFVLQKLITSVKPYKESKFAKVEGASEKRMYQKTFIMRMTTCSFSSVVAQLNGAEAEAVRSLRFASSLKVDLK